jgi:hypothetical protein
MKLPTIIIAGLLTASSAYADGMIYPPAPVPVPQLEWHQPLTFPRHITRNGEPFFCPYAEYDPWCTQPNDYSWNLEGPPWNRRPSGEPPHVPFAATTRWPPGWSPERAMQESRERVIEMGEAHCRAFPQDSICHPPKPQ